MHDSHRSLAALLGVALLVVFGPAEAHATITQEVSVSHADPSGNGTADSDLVAVPPDPTLRTVAAEIIGSSFSARAGVGVFGNLGAEAEMFTLGTLSTQVSIFSDEFVNPFSNPVHALANFIIDGGRLAMLAGDGSLLSFQLALTASIHTASGAPDHDESFVSNIELLQTATGLDVQTSGPSLGATFDGFLGVDIPLSFQTFDLGLIPGGGSIDLDYLLTIRSQTVGFVEIVAWQYSDPANIDGIGDFPTVRFLDAPGAVPAPPGLVLLAAGLVGLGGRQWWSRSTRGRRRRT